MNAPFRPCAVIPTFDNPRTVGAALQAIHAHLPDIILVDDGSGPEGRAACEQAAAAGLASLERRPTNGGKGAAVKRGLALAHERGFTHAFQVDADGQHDIAAMPTFLEAARRRPDALVLAYPEYDESSPRGRRIARQLTAFWVAVEVGTPRLIRDAMIGFRVYPLQVTQGLHVPGDHMDFDIEIAVLLARRGVPIVNLPVRVRYLPPEQGGVSHFQLVRDNLRFFGMHARLCTSGVLGWAERHVGGGR